MYRKIGVAKGRLSALTISVNDPNSHEPYISIDDEADGRYLLIYSPEQARQVVDALETSIFELWGNGGNEDG